MNPILKTPVALALTLLLAVPAAGESITHFPHARCSAGLQACLSRVDIGGESRVLVQNTTPFRAQSDGLAKNPPAAVRQPGSRTRVITAIAFVGGLAGLALWLCGSGGCGR